MFLAIMSAFVGGLILNLMPCVFPIISLKAFNMARHAGDPKHLRREGSAFLAGSMAAMLALAGILIALRASGTAVGWGFQLQSPPVVAILMLVMLAAGLNLAGLFEIGTGLQRAGQTLDRGTGMTGAALTGALAVVVATPCAGPFMAGAIGFALVQPPLAALAIFAALGAGVAAPFTLLSFSPSLARWLPRPGAWMATLKQILAFPMFAAAAWLLWILAQQVGSAGLGLLLTCVVLTAMVAWLHGLAQRRSMAGRSALWLHAGTVAGVAIMCAVGAKAVDMPADRGSQIATRTVADRAPITWSPERVALERAAGHPIFVDFTAAWCLTCKVNEKAVLSTEAFRNAIARSGTVFMVADSTNYDVRVEDVMASLGRSGLPLYLVYPADGGQPVVLPQILDRKTVEMALEKASGGKV